MGSHFQRTGHVCTAWPRHPAVEADHARQGEFRPAAGEKRQPTAEAEPDREHRTHAACGEMVPRGLRVEQQGLVSSLLNVRHEIEFLATIVRHRRATEVVDRQGVDVAFGEPKSELLVEMMQTPHIGQHDHSGSRRRPRACVECEETRTVGSVQFDPPSVDCRAGQGRDWRSAIEVETHAMMLSPQTAFGRLLRVHGQLAARPDAVGVRAADKLAPHDDDREE